MKKGKIFGKKQLLLAVMVLALGGAIWLNMEYSATSGGFTNTVSNSNKNLGDTKFVATDEVVETSAKVDDYFETAKKDRETSRNDALKLIEETLKSTEITDAQKQEAMNELTKAAKAVTQEADIETELVAKGFSKVLCMINGEKATVIVKSEGVTSAQTLQIQDSVTSKSNISLENIKIVTVK